MIIINELASVKTKDILTPSDSRTKRKTVPCGTLDPTSAKFEKLPSTTTHCLRLFRKSVIKSNFVINAVVL